MLVFFFFFFKQTTAYEISVRDWSSDVCSSDLPTPASRTALARAVSYLAAIGYETTRIGPKGKWQARPTERQPDIVLLGTGDVGEVIAEVKRIHAAAPRARVLVAVDAVTTKAA